MNQSPKTTLKNPSNKSMGITFEEIHSDEPYEEVSVKEDTIEQKYLSKKSHLSNSDDVFNVSKAFESDRTETGTIVSDRRRHRPSFWNNVRAAFVEWWGGVEKKIAHTSESIQVLPKKDRATVSKAKSRAYVIQKAAENATLAPQDDYRVVVEKMRTYKQDVANVTGVPLVIKEEPKEKEIAWTHTEEVKPESKKTDSYIPYQTPDLRSTMIAPTISQPELQSKSIHETNQQPEFEKKMHSIEEWYKKNPSLQKVSTVHTPHTTPNTTSFTSGGPVHIAPEVERPVQVPIPQTVKSAPVQTKPVKSTPIIPTPVAQTPPPTPQRIETSVQNETFHNVPPVPSMPKQPEENLPPALIVPVSKITKQKPPHIKESRPYTPAPNNSSLRIYVRWAILGGIVIVGIALAVFASMYFNIFEKNTDPTNPTVTIPTLIKTTQQYEVPLGDTGETFLNELNTKVTSAPQGVTQFYPTLSDGASVRPATSNEIFVSLGTHLDAKTIRALDDTLMFGSVTSVSNEAFLVLRSRNFDTLFAGMLAWESYIATDFSPLFGTAPQTNTRFTDAVRNNNATRILYDTTQKEILLYSFVNQNTVVITTSSEALSKIIEQF